MPLSVLLGCKILVHNQLQVNNVTDRAKPCPKPFLFFMNKKSNHIGKWYALYTRPRWEKKVDRLLKEKGFDSYCPLNKVYRQWSDRVKVVDEPLFKSYVFVRLDEDQKQSVRMVPGVVNFVYWLGKPAIIKPKEIEAIRKFMNEHEQVEVRSLELAPNDEVVVLSGPFMERKGLVKRVMHKKVEIVIESIGYSLVAYIDKSKLSRISKAAPLQSKTA